MSFLIEDILKINKELKSASNLPKENKQSALIEIERNNPNKSSLKINNICINKTTDNGIKRTEIRKPTPLKFPQNYSPNSCSVLQDLSSPVCSAGDMSYNSPILSSPNFFRTDIPSGSPYTNKIFFSPYETFNRMFDGYNSVFLQHPRFWHQYPTHLKNGNTTYMQYARCSQLNKRKGGQIRFSPIQTDALEKRFDANKYLSPDDRRNLADSLKLSDRQVKTWFQNRRAKWRRFNQVSTTMDDKLLPTNLMQANRSVINKTSS